MTHCLFDCSYSDIEDVDWLTIKRTLSSSDSWSICRLGDYFVKTSQNKRRRHSPDAQGAKSLESRSNSHEHATATDDDSSCSSTEDFDMLDDIYGRSPLFRIMPQSSGTTEECAESIVEAGEYSSIDRLNGVQKNSPALRRCAWRWYSAAPSSVLHRLVHRQSYRCTVAYHTV